jgi:tryptophan 7-halogenase
MTTTRDILIVGGGTAGWLTAAYLARTLGTAAGGVRITLVESSDIGIIGVGEGTFPSIRGTLAAIGLDEARFIRECDATFKQGVKFVDWLHPRDAVPPRGADHYFHPFNAPSQRAGAPELLPYWLLGGAGERAFADAVSMQKRVADASRAPKRASDGDYLGPMNYAYHFDAGKFATLLATHAKTLGVAHAIATVERVELAEDGTIAAVITRERGPLSADLYIDCTGFRAEMIGQAPGAAFKSVRHHLFADRALACKLPVTDPDAPMESCTIATAHEAGWTWEIGLNGARGIGCVYSSDHMTDDRAAEVLRGYVGAGDGDLATRRIPFAPGYRERQWVKNCVAVGLSAGLVLIEAAVGMIAEMFPHGGPIEAPARRFNELMTARFENIVNFLKLHYCVSRREEPFWRDNADVASVPERLAEFLEQWKYRPPGRFDFMLDTETFAFFNYQYILYGMGYRTDMSAARADFPQVDEAERLFAKIRRFGDRALVDLPSHRSLIQQINASAIRVVA